MEPGEICEILGSKVTNVEAKFGTFFNIFTLYASNETARIWIYLCDWDLLIAGSVGASSSEFDEFSLRKGLLGKSLVSIESKAPNRLLISFTDETELELHDREDLYGLDDMLIVFLPDGRTLSYRKDRGFYLEGMPR